MSMESGYPNQTSSLIRRLSLFENEEINEIEEVKRQQEKKAMEELCAEDDPTILVPVQSGEIAPTAFTVSLHANYRKPSLLARFVKLSLLVKIVIIVGLGLLITFGTIRYNDYRARKDLEELLQSALGLQEGDTLEYMAEQFDKSRKEQGLSHQEHMEMLRAAFKYGYFD